ncbi:MAG: phage Gp37/Gp68 family protein [Nitrospiraceae bacterium]
MENSKIEWTDHTFNPWVGCTKVSEGCKFCYAETLMDHRYHKVQWGPTGTRVRTAVANWRKPLQWNKLAWETCKECGWRGPVHETHDFCPNCDGEELLPARARVFCASLADVFEDRPELAPWRTDLFEMIAYTPALDWLLLTKRPQNVLPLVTEAMKGLIMDGKARSAGRWEQWLAGEGLRNVWIGTTVENQEAADKRIPELSRVPAAVRFLSCEPLIGPVDLKLVADVEGFEVITDTLRGNMSIDGQVNAPVGKIHWVVAGGESGHEARPMNPEWPRSLRVQCGDAGVPFFFKQWGEWVGVGQITEMRTRGREDLFHWGGGAYSARVGKTTAGRLLDGVDWNEFPVGP